MDDQPSSEKEIRKDEPQEVREMTHETVRSSETAGIDPEVERRCWKKFDMYVLPQVYIIYLLSFLDRSNIGNARVMGLEKETGLVGKQFNTIAALFFITFASFEMVWGVLLKYIGANRCMAIGIVCWSAVTVGTGFCNNYHDIVACRLLLGVFEACVGPAMHLVISMTWPRKMQAKRMGVIYYGICTSGAFGGLIAYGVQLMGRRNGLSAWRWLFFIEGIVSLVVGMLCWISLPPNAEKAWFLTTEEKATMIAIKEREIAYRGKQEFEWKFVRITLSDPMTYFWAVIGIIVAYPALGFSLFGPTLILALGFTRLEANYLSIPLYALATIMIVVLTWLSDRLNRRSLLLLFTMCIGATGYIIALASHSNALGFAAMFVIAAGVYPLLCLLITWIINNWAPDNKRIIAVPIQLSCTLLSGLVGSYLYPASDGPRYVMGNSLSLGALGVASLGVATSMFIYHRRNAQKAKMIAEGATENKYEDDRGLHFTYVY